MGFKYRLNEIVVKKTAKSNPGKIVRKKVIKGDKRGMYAYDVKFLRGGTLNMFERHIKKANRKAKKAWAAANTKGRGKSLRRRRSMVRLY